MRPKLLIGEAAKPLRSKPQLCIRLVARRDADGGSPSLVLRS